MAIRYGKKFLSRKRGWQDFSDAEKTLFSLSHCTWKPMVDIFYRRWGWCYSHLRLSETRSSREGQLKKVDYGSQNFSWVTEWLEACMDSPPYWYSIPLWQLQGREGIALKRTCLEEVESLNPSQEAVKSLSSLKSSGRRQLREQASVVSLLLVILSIRGYSVLSIYGLRLYWSAFPWTVHLISPRVRLIPPLFQFWS